MYLRKIMKYVAQWERDETQKENDELSRSMMKLSRIMMELSRRMMKLSRRMLQNRKVGNKNRHPYDRGTDKQTDKGLQLSIP